MDEFWDKLIALDCIVIEGRHPEVEVVEADGQVLWEGEVESGHGYDVVDVPACAVLEDTETLGEEGLEVGDQLRLGAADVV